MVEIEARYDGSKKCSLRHQEGVTLQTDAPKDIGGDASAFSPTDHGRGGPGRVRADHGRDVRRAA